MFLETCIKRNTLDKKKKVYLLLLYSSFMLMLTFKPIPFRGYKIIPLKVINDLYVYPNQFILFIGNILMYSPIGFAICRLPIIKDLF